MNPIIKMLLDALIKYVLEHPDEMQKIIELIVKAIIKHFEDNPISLSTSNQGVVGVGSKRDF